MNTIDARRIVSSCGAMAALLSALPFVGCAGDAAPEDAASQAAPRAEHAGSATDPLVGGTATLLSPEIGQFKRSYIWCTGTLFTPRYVVTAAHCVRYNDITARSDDKFEVTSPLGAVTAYPVDKIASFGTQRGEWLPGASGTSDVAILRLTTPVPLSNAIPRALSSTVPPIGTRVTTFGYGCTDRNAQNTTGGYKQFFSFSYSSPTTSLCPGDSGGPDVFGEALGLGEIWGVNSDYAGTPGQFPSWVDIFGDVAFMKPRINAMTREWESRDFSADGNTDILWHNPSTGQLSVWLMKGTTAFNHVELDWTAAASSGWKPMGSGDFDNDGNSDVLWWHPADGQVGVWRLDGSGHVWGTMSIDWRAADNTGWTISGTGDFNGDGYLDILWWNPGTGEVNPWYLNGSGHVIGNGAFSWSAAASTNWKIVGTGDFNGDGMMDVLWHKWDTGDVAVWIMDNAGHVQSGPMVSWKTAESSGWKVVGTGDYNGDNKIDILWHNGSTGQVSAWLLDGTNVLSGPIVNWTAASSTGWAIVSR